MVDEVTPERSYASNASIIVLAAFALIEAASIFGVGLAYAMRRLIPFLRLRLSFSLGFSVWFAV
jgi:hypothetical protein